MNIYPLATETADRIVLGDLTPPDVTCGACGGDGFVGGGSIETPKRDRCLACAATGALPTAIEFDLWGNEKLVTTADGSERWWYYPPNHGIKLFPSCYESPAGESMRALTRADLRRIALSAIGAGGEWIARTAYPERVRRTWPEYVQPDPGPRGGNFVGVRTKRRFRNLTIAAYIETQAEADARVPVVAMLSDLCRMGAWVKPEGEINLRLKSLVPRDDDDSSTTDVFTVFITRAGSSPAACDDLVRQCREAGVTLLEIGETT